jgi:hypothetical protein
MRILSGLQVSILLVLVTACTARQQPPSSPQGEYRPTATIKDIMDSMVDPGADAIWESVATTVDATGIHDKFPQNDEEWKEVRRRAITLMEATNLLMMPGRIVAKPGDKSENPGIELSPEEIQVVVNQDKDSFNKFARGLYDSVIVSLKAIEAKDKDALLDSGNAIDRACESCHLKYWYPNEAKNLAEADVRTPNK